MGNGEGCNPVRVADLLVGAVKLYQRGVSPFIGPCCRFFPSCSEYMIQSIRMNGCALGVIDGFWRILRCHPFNPGGVDEPRRLHLLGTRARWKEG